MRLATGPLLALIVSIGTLACGPAADPHILTFAGSAVGREAEVIRQQLDRFRAAHPELTVELRPTPDASDQRHQLYVQWLNARVADPDVLQLDVVWTPEFAAAGWILDLDRFEPDIADFFPAAIEANRWNGSLYALPWFVDVGMLYWRTDLMTKPPGDLEQLRRQAMAARDGGAAPYGLVWHGARYEGLVTVFLEYLGAYGGRILDRQNQVVVDSDAAVKALTFMRDAIEVDRFVPAAVLTWQEEQVRFAFQNGQAAFMRNWPYAYSLLEQSPDSKVAGRFAVAAMPGADGGAPTAALGGSQLAINAHSSDSGAAYHLIEFLLGPEQMLERARVAGQYPPRPSMFNSPALAEALPVRLDDVRQVIERAVNRPVTPVYSQLSELLQVSLHRALTRQQEPAAALHDAAAAMRQLLQRVHLTSSPS